MRRSIRVKISQAAGTDPIIPKLSRYSSDSGRKLKIKSFSFLLLIQFSCRDLSLFSLIKLVYSPGALHRVAQSVHISIQPPPLALDKLKAQQNCKIQQFRGKRNWLNCKQCIESKTLNFEKTSKMTFNIGHPVQLQKRNIKTLLFLDKIFLL